MTDVAAARSRTRAGTAPGAEGLVTAIDPRAINGTTAKRAMAAGRGRRRRRRFRNRKCT
jgi:hypothetical protein